LRRVQANKKSRPQESRGSQLKGGKEGKRAEIARRKGRRWEPIKIREKPMGQKRNEEKILMGRVRGKEGRHLPSPANLLKGGIGGDRKL